MATARISRPTRTNKPTRNSDQVICLRCAIRACLRVWQGMGTTTIQESDQKSPEIRIPGVHQFIRRALKIDLALAEHQKMRGGAHRSGRGAIAQNLFTLRIETKISHGETVLQTVRGQQSGDAVGVAQTENETDNGSRSNGIEARGWRIIQNDRR